MPNCAADQHRQVRAAAVAVQHQPRRQQRSAARSCQAANAASSTTPAARKPSVDGVASCGSRRWKARRPGRTSTPERSPRRVCPGAGARQARAAAGRPPPRPPRRRRTASSRTGTSASPGTRSADRRAAGPPARRRPRWPRTRRTRGRVLGIAERRGEHPQRRRRQQRGERSLAGAAVISIVKLVDAPPTAEARAKPVSPVRNVTLRPNRSPSRPPTAAGCRTPARRR